MPAPFKKVSLDQFAELLVHFPFTRAINAVHMHHTWHPNHQQFKGHDTIAAMWSFHTEHNGWSDIAQHITIAPDGAIWLGRNWNMAPASTVGQNGDAKAGPFMFEVIGDFEVGADPFAGAQRDTAVAVIALLQNYFSPPPDSLKFHDLMSDKASPASSIDYQQTLDDVRLHRAASAAMAATVQRGDGKSNQPRGGALPAPDQVQRLLPHLVDLSMGEFSSDGAWTTTRADVDAIFADHLPRALQEARKKGQPLRLMLQASGGLNNEAAGLAIALKSVDWWQANGIYPIYFAWETGLLDTIGRLLQRSSRSAAARDPADYLTDPVIQELARALQAPKIWGGMKLSAQLASSPDTAGHSHSPQAGNEGGAYYVAQQLAAFCDAHADQMQVHAVGHSAGAIFHAWFIPAALELGVPVMRSLQLMAPALRVDLFKEKLAPLLGRGQGIDELTIYAMKENLEAGDTCAGVYRKSLLYLIHHALEAQRKTPILGLEECLRADQDLSRMFGLDGSAGSAEVIWSQTAARQGRSASMAISHGRFDDDPATMGSMARRILGKADHETIVEYPAPAPQMRAAPLDAQPQHLSDTPMPDMTQLIALLQSVEHLLQQNQAPMPHAGRTPGRKPDMRHAAPQSMQHGDKPNR